jgi:microcystin degradation protein MlrC
VDILISPKRNQTFDPEVFLLHGIDVTQRRIIALKGCDHYRAGFASVAKAFIAVDSPGLNSARIERFSRSHQAGPLWPLDPEAMYPSRS